MLNKLKMTVIFVVTLIFFSSCNHDVSNEDTGHIPFISINDKGIFEFYEIDFKNNEIIRSEDSTIASRFNEKASMRFEKEPLKRESFYWDGISEPLFIDNFKSNGHFIPGAYIFIDEGLLKIVKVNGDQMSPAKTIVDFNEFYKKNPKYRANLDRIFIINVEYSTDGFYQLLMVMEYERPIDDVYEEVIEIKTDGESLEFTTLKNELIQKADVTFEKFDNFIKVDTRIIGKMIIIDRKTQNIIRNDKPLKAKVSEIAKKMNIDINKPEYDGVLGSINGTYNEYQISCLKVSGGKFPEYVNFIFDKNDLVKIVAYKNGFVSFYDAKGNLEKEYSDMKFDYMFFPLINQENFEIFK